MVLIVKNYYALVALLLIAVAMPAYGQDQASQPPDSKGLLSFVDDVFGSVRNNAGFTLGAHESYVSNLQGTQYGDRDAQVSSFMARVFVNFGRQRSRFHLNYGGAYRLYHGREGLDGVAHLGNASYTYQASRRVSIGISDNFHYSPNDFSSFWGPSLNVPMPIPEFSDEPVYARQKVLRNSLNGNVGIRTSRKSHLGLFVGHSFYRYEERDIGDWNSYHAGLSFNYEIKTWLDFSTHYAIHFGGRNRDDRDTMIHRLNVGSFTFHPTRRWNVSFGGNLQAADTYDRTYYGAGGSASLRYTSEATSFSAGYHRGFSSSIGIPGVFQSDRVTANFGRRISTRLNYHLGAHYNHSNYRSGIGSYELFSVGTGLEIAIAPNLVGSLGYNYWNQRRQSIEDLLPYINRYSVHAGLQFVWPGGRQ